MYVCVNTDWTHVSVIILITLAWLKIGKHNLKSGLTTILISQYKYTRNTFICHTGVKELRLCLVRGAQSKEPATNE